MQLLSTSRLLAEDPDSGKKRIDLDLGGAKSSDGAGGAVFTHGTVAYTGTRFNGQILAHG